MRRGMALWGMGRADEPEWVVLLTLTIALALGWLTQSWALGRTDTAAVGSMTLAYPAGWLHAREEGAAFAAADLAKGAFAPRVSLWEVPRQDLLPAGIAAETEPTLTAVAAAWSLKRSEQLSAYRPLKSERSSVQGREAIRVSYAYVSDAGARTVPKVMRAVDTVVLAGDKVLVLSFAAESDDFADLAGQHERILASWRLP